MERGRESFLALRFFCFFVRTERCLLALVLSASSRSLCFLSFCPFCLVPSHLQSPSLCLPLSDFSISPSLSLSPLHSLPRSQAVAAFTKQLNAKEAPKPQAPVKKPWVLPKIDPDTRTFLVGGKVMRKHTEKGAAPHERYVHLTPDLRFIVWADPKKPKR